MAMTDLTGTKWLINDNPDISDYYPTTGYDLYFTSNDIDFSLINFVVASRIGGIQYDTDFAYVDYDDTSAGLSEGWQNEAYRTIEITGGTDATNANLISWLQSNATQITEQSNTFSFGNLPIANMYFGTRQVKKVYLGNTLVWEKEENLISFTIAGTSYQAEEGMTWGEWVASEYNTDGFLVNGTVIFPPTSIQMYVVYHGVAVSTSEGIVAERAYTTGIEN